MPNIPYTDGEETLGDDYPATPKRIFDLIDVAKALIFIKNTHGSNGLKYKILAYADKEDNDSVKELVAETTLAAGGVLVETLTDPYECISIPMKNAVGGSNATVKAWVNTKLR